jgi:hypothetical protein
VTLVEVAKFLKNAKDYVGDNCRLAQWLRAIDTLNREADFSEFANDPVFKVLQNEVKLCNFSSRYLMTVDMSDFDRAVAEYSTKMDIAKKMLEQGKLSVTEISAVTGLPEAKIRDLK